MTLMTRKRMLAVAGLTVLTLSVAGIRLGGGRTVVAASRTTTVAVSPSASPNMGVGGTDPLQDLGLGQDESVITGDGILLTAPTVPTPTIAAADALADVAACNGGLQPVAGVWAHVTFTKFGWGPTQISQDGWVFAMNPVDFDGGGSEAGPGTQLPSTRTTPTAWVVSFVGLNLPWGKCFGTSGGTGQAL